MIEDQNGGANKTHSLQYSDVLIGSIEILDLEWRYVIITLSK